MEFTYQAMIHDIQIAWKGEGLTSQPTTGSLTIQSYISQIHTQERPDTDNDKSRDLDREYPSERLENLALETLYRVDNSGHTLRYGIRDRLFMEHWEIMLDPGLATSELKAEKFDTVVLYAYKDHDIDWGHRYDEKKTLPTWHIVHLVLKRVDDRNGVYKRIGLLHRQPDFKRSKEEIMSHLGEEREITLI
ncbi:uncharacterized protein N0V89_003469 [Didymosphaeria variabile]|uniref:Uncharacterized protein n=1 Tax=Didymosphaeria variabile TaxID=1932322 RepID=A0A9W8XMP8_9PLEO|nr:uncharacterized protein N0V89_003469 [Didymosphaeria variabile]KAJ4355453.1 hypothetical protein N0V89_003469 [Didymosphaeria variabile]